jgi:predicted RND superfamily exporter protein
MISEQVHQHIGAVGTGVTASAGFIGFVTSAIPVLQALSLTVSVLVGLVTVIWYVLKIKRGK